MSCYGWERGNVTLPAGEFSLLKKSLIEKLTFRQEKLLNIANEIYTKIKTQKPKDKNEFIHIQLKNNGLSYSEEEQIRDSLIKDKKVMKPKKQNFKLDKSKLSFHDGDLTVRLEKETRSVIYHTDDNNHAVDDARETFLGRTIIDLLNRAKYSTHTGGYFQSRTEYDDEASSARITQTFGKYKSGKHLKSLYKF